MNIKNTKTQISNPLNGNSGTNLPCPDSIKFKNKTHHSGHHVDNAQYLNFRRRLRAPLFRGR